MKFFRKSGLVYCIVGVLSFIVGAFLKPSLGFIVNLVSIAILSIFTVRLCYKTTIKDDYVYNEYINANICQKSDKKYYLLLIISGFLLSLLFFIIKYEPIYLFFYLGDIIFGFIAAYFWINGEKYQNLNDMKKSAKYIMLGTFIVIMIPAILYVSFTTIIEESSEYFTVEEVKEIIAEYEKRFGEGEKYNYLFHTERCEDSFELNCEISIYGYFDSDDNALILSYSKDKNGKLKYKAVNHNYSKELFIEQANKGGNRKFNIE